jgi:uncharacterized protein YbjT (DUF2867 family)
MKTSRNLTNDNQPKDILIIGGTGKTGRRVAEKLNTRGVRARLGSRSTTPRFDWENEATWLPALHGVGAVYLTYYPDLAIPGAVRAVRGLVEAARQQKVQHIVLLSGRGEEEAQQAERVVQESGLDWTIVRASWFAQNFSESYLLDAVRGGEVVLPANNIGEPFVDADDIADVAVAALTDDHHKGQLYELTGPRMLTFPEAVGEIAKAIEQDIRYIQVSPQEFTESMNRQGVPKDIVWLLNYLFTTVLDGRNAYLTDGVQRALGRPPRDFADYVKKTAAEGVWRTPHSPRSKP